MHPSCSATEKNHSIFMRKREVTLCSPCGWINNSTFSSPVMIFPQWLWNTALRQLALGRLYMLCPFRKPKRKYEKNAPGTLKWLCSHSQPGCDLGKVWCWSLLRCTPPGQPQPWGEVTQHPTLSPKTKGPGPSRPSVAPVHGGKGRGSSREPDRCCHDGSGAWSAGCPLRQHADALLTFQPDFWHGLMPLSYLIEALHRIKTEMLK